MCSKSNPLVVFALDLMSTYEGEHRIFGLLGQANLTQNDVLQFEMGIFHIKIAPKCKSILTPKRLTKIKLKITKVPLSTLEGGERTWHWYNLMVGSSPGTEPRHCEDQ
jgi:hypothetical protein